LSDTREVAGANPAVSIVLGYVVVRYGSDSTAAAFYGCGSAARADRTLEDFSTSFFERLAGLDRDVSSGRLQE
jgi:hypothetical protein